MQGWLYVRPRHPSEGMQAFAKQVSLKEDSGALTYSMSLHDAVNLYAHAATKVLAEGGDLNNGSAVTEAVRGIRIQGVGNNPVVLNSHGDRIQSYEVMNYVQGEGGGTDSVVVGAYNSSSMNYTVRERLVVWPGATTVVPVDYVREVRGFAGSMCKQIPSCTYLVCALSDLWAPKSG